MPYADPETAREKAREYSRRYRERHSEVLASIRATPERKAQLRAYHRAWYEKNRESRDTAIQRWQAANRERLKQKQQEYNARRPEVMRAAYERYRRANLEKFRLKGARRRALARATQVGPIDYRALLAAANGACQICLKPLGERHEIDHIMPLARGGAHVQGNLQVVHPACNRRKCAKVA